MKFRLHLVGIKNVDAVERLINSTEISSGDNIIVTINNNGTPGDYDPLYQKFNFVQIFEEGNIGIVKAWNMGIIKAKEDGCDAIILIPNDGYFEPGAFKKGLEHFESGNGNEIGNYSYIVGDIHLPNKVHIDSCIFPLTLFDEIGMFDERFKLCYYEDLDLWMRINEKGIYINVYNDCPYHNFAGGNRKIAQETGMVTPIQLYMYRLLNNMSYYLKWESKFNEKVIAGERGSMYRNMKILMYMMDNDKSQFLEKENPEELIALKGKEFDTSIKESVAMSLASKKYYDVVDKFARESFLRYCKQNPINNSYSWEYKNFELIDDSNIRVNYEFGAEDMEYSGYIIVNINTGEIIEL